MRGREIVRSLGRETVRSLGKRGSAVLGEQGSRWRGWAAGGEVAGLFEALTSSTMASKVHWKTAAGVERARSQKKQGPQRVVSKALP